MVGARRGEGGGYQASAKLPQAQSQCDAPANGTVSKQPLPSHNQAPRVNSIIHQSSPTHSGQRSSPSHDSSQSPVNTGDHVPATWDPTPVGGGPVDAWRKGGDKKIASSTLDSQAGPGAREDVVTSEQWPLAGMFTDAVFPPAVQSADDQQWAESEGDQKWAGSEVSVLDQPMTSEVTTVTNPLSEGLLSPLHHHSTTSTPTPSLDGTPRAILSPERASDSSVDDPAILQRGQKVNHSSGVHAERAPPGLTGAQKGFVGTTLDQLKPLAEFTMPEALGDSLPEGEGQISMTTALKCEPNPVDQLFSPFLSDVFSCEETQPCPQPPPTTTLTDPIPPPVTTVTVDSPRVKDQATEAFFPMAYPLENDVQTGQEEGPELGLLSRDADTLADKMVVFDVQHAPPTERPQIAKFSDGSSEDDSSISTIDSRIHKSESLQTSDHLPLPSATQAETASGSPPSNQSDRLATAQPDLSKEMSKTPSGILPSQPCPAKPVFPAGATPDFDEETLNVSNLSHTSNTSISSTPSSTEVLGEETSRRGSYEFADASSSTIMNDLDFLSDCFPALGRSYLGLLYQQCRGDVSTVVSRALVSSDHAMSTPYNMVFAYPLLGDESYAVMDENSSTVSSTSHTSDLQGQPHTLAEEEARADATEPALWLINYLRSDEEDRPADLDKDDDFGHLLDQEMPDLEDFEGLANIDQCIDDEEIARVLQEQLNLDVEPGDKRQPPSLKELAIKAQPQEQTRGSITTEGGGGEDANLVLKLSRSLAQQLQELFGSVSELLHIPGLLHESELYHCRLTFNLSQVS